MSSISKQFETALAEEVLRLEGQIAHLDAMRTTLRALLNGQAKSESENEVVEEKIMPIIRKGRQVGHGPVKLIPGRPVARHGEIQQWLANLLADGEFKSRADIYAAAMSNGPPSLMAITNEAKRHKILYGRIATAIWRGLVRTHDFVEKDGKIRMTRKGRVRIG